MKKYISIVIVLLISGKLFSQEIFFIGSAGDKDKIAITNLLGLIFSSSKYKSIDLRYYNTSLTNSSEVSYKKKDFKKKRNKALNSWLASISKDPKNNTSYEAVINNLIADNEKLPPSIIFIASENIERKLINKPNPKDSLIFYSDINFILKNSKFNKRMKYIFVQTGDKKPNIKLLYPVCNNNLIDCQHNGACLQFQWNNTGNKKVTFNLKEPINDISINIDLFPNDENYNFDGNYNCFYLPFEIMNNKLKEVNEKKGTNYNVNNFKNYPNPFYWSISFEWYGNIESTEECNVKGCCITSNSDDVCNCKSE
jgi:hypothetical protein